MTALLLSLLRDESCHRITELLLLTNSTQSRPKHTSLNSLLNHLIQVQIPQQPPPNMLFLNRLLAPCEVLLPRCSKSLNRLCSTAVYSWCSLAWGHWEAHITEKKTEAQKGQVTPLRSHRMLGYRILTPKHTSGSLAMGHWYLCVLTASHNLEGSMLTEIIQTKILIIT